MSSHHADKPSTFRSRLTTGSHEYKLKACLANSKLAQETRRGGVQSLGECIRKESLSPPIAVSAVDT